MFFSSAIQRELFEIFLLPFTASRSCFFFFCRSAVHRKPFKNFLLPFNRSTSSVQIFSSAVRVCGPFFKFISREISQATSSLVSRLETRKTRLESLETRLETRSSKFSRIENRVSRLEDRDARDCLLTFERYCTFTIGDHGVFTINRAKAKMLLEIAVDTLKKSSDMRVRIARTTNFEMVICRTG